MLKCLNFSNASNTAKTRNVAHPKTQVVPNPIVIQKKFHTTQYSSKSYQWLSCDITNQDLSSLSLDNFEGVLELIDHDCFSELLR